MSQVEVTLANSLIMLLQQCIRSSSSTYIHTHTRTHIHNTHITYTFMDMKTHKHVGTYVRTYIHTHITYIYKNTNTHTINYVNLYSTHATHTAVHKNIHTYLRTYCLRQKAQCERWCTNFPLFYLLYTMRLVCGVWVNCVRDWSNLTYPYRSYRISTKKWEQSDRRN
jgi:hypothetical protein